MKQVKLGSILFSIVKYLSLAVFSAVTLIPVCV